MPICAACHRRSACYAAGVPSVPRDPEAPNLDLPELDKADEGGEVDVGIFELSMGEELDLEEGYGTADGFEIGINEQPNALGDDSTLELDIGIPELLSPPFEEQLAHDSERPEPPGLGLGLNLELPLEEDDPAEVELGDDGLENLPELARDEADGAAGPDAEGDLLPFVPEGEVPLGPAFAVEWLSRGEACSALWAGAAGVFVAANELMGFNPPRPGQRLPSGARASSLAWLGLDQVLLATTRGLLEIAPSGATTFVQGPEVSRSSDNDVLEVACASAEHSLWARLSGGALFRRRGQAWERHETGGRVRSLASVAFDITLLVISSRATLQHSVDGGISFRELLLPEAAATVALGNAPRGIALGRVVAIADSERGLCVSADRGETFRMVTGAVNVSAIEIGQYRGVACLFAAIHREAKDSSEILMVEPGSGAACRVGELTGKADDEGGETGRTLALAWDGQALWAAGGYGLARLVPAANEHSAEDPSVLPN